MSALHEVVPIDGLAFDQWLNLGVLAPAERSQLRPAGTPLSDTIVTFKPSRAVELLIERYLHRLRTAADGTKHVELYSVSHQLGGIAAEIGLSNAEAIEMLADALPTTVEDLEKARQTALDGLTTGRARPLDLRAELRAWSLDAAYAFPDVDVDDPPLIPKPPVLSITNPDRNARQFVIQLYTRDGCRTLHHSQGTFEYWTGTHYAPLAAEEMRAAIYRFLSEALRIDGEGKLVPFGTQRHM